jgi:GT2 family glycosyltransferase
VATQVEVCIVSFDSAGHISRAVDSVARHIPGASIAVREHGPTGTGADDALAAAARNEVPFRLDADRRNVGFGAGCNALAAGSTAEWLLFLNPDAAITSWPWHPAPGQRGRIYGPILSGNGRPGKHYGRSYRIRDEVSRSWLRRTGTEPVGIGFVSGAALLVHSDDFRQLGGFDEGFFMYYEDIDLCLRANAGGVGTFLEHAWRVDHVGMHSTNADRRAALLRSFRSACRFHRNQGERVWLFRSYVVIDAALRWTRAAASRDAPSRRAYASLIRQACSPTSGETLPPAR